MTYGAAVCVSRALHLFLREKQKNSIKAAAARAVPPTPQSDLHATTGGTQPPPLRPCRDPATEWLCGDVELDKRACA